MIHWKAITEFIEPNWDELDNSGDALLFWRAGKKPVLGHIRDGELFDHNWLYVCDSNKVTHFSEINDPVSNLAQMGTTVSDR